ncbi:hypothetical protein LHJ74_12685 [Streptomyces sp. N2-109]|uniref:Uncharacterized protein n=1 Tax=Streptomyces gossypii TaxID=2883101 RepID=A0ABT2JSL9_9ACTN|nr:hypothetical protein [Streptomyces gossypii]MCT2590756.1 hypothetical protein [Streptomyces gossypii]
MEYTRNDKLIALGTWGVRGKRLPVPDDKAFQPVDTAPPGSAQTDTMHMHIKNNNDLLNKVPPGAAMARVGLRLISNHRKEKARQGPRWNVKRAGDAAGAFLDDVAVYCLGQWNWGLAAEAELSRLLPGLSAHLRRLTNARDVMRQHEKFRVRSRAAELTEPALADAQHISQTIGAHYRAVPPPASMPWIVVRLTAAQRARALAGAVATYDVHVGSWYAFVFAPPLPSTRAPMLRDLSAALRVEPAVRACEAKRKRCHVLACTGAVARRDAREAVQELKDAVSAFEEAVYRAVATGT